MRAFLFFWIITLPVFALTNHQEAESIERLSEIAATLSDEVAGAGTVGCDSMTLSMQNPELAAENIRQENAERTLRVGYLSTCLRNRTIRNNVWRDVMEIQPVLCTTRRNQRVHYKIGRQNGHIRIQVPLNFRWNGEARNETRGRRMLTDALSCAQNFYGQYGISVSVLNDPNPANPVVAFTDNIGRSNTGSFQLGENHNHNACTMVVHEIGHWMGLPDRYANQTCTPNPGVVSGSSDVMNNGGVYPPEVMHLNAIDLRTILSPLCEGRMIR